MYIKINKSKIPIEIKTTLKDKIKSFRFKLTKIDYGLCFPHKRRINTYFYCQNVDIIMTDKENKIIKMFSNQTSEKHIRGNRKVYYTYVLPTTICNIFDIGDTLPIITTKEEDEFLVNYKQKKKDKTSLS